MASSSHIFLFADDTKFFKHILCPEDCESLQKDVSAMCQWANKSKLKFHPEKCVYMRIGRGTTPEYTYTMGPNNLKKSSQEKDLGVIIDDKLNFETHTSTKINKANSVMGVIRRTFNYMNNRSFMILYKSLVRPILEYANQVWSPQLKKHINAIENVQRRATKTVPGLSEKTYEQRLRDLDLPTLAFRRLRGDMIEVYKQLTDKYDPRVKCFLTSSDNRNTRGHQYKLAKERSRLMIRKNSFANRNVNTWNNLPEQVVSSPSVNSFKGRLDKYWKNHPMKYDIDYVDNAMMSGMRTQSINIDYSDLSLEASKDD